MEGLNMASGIELGMGGVWLGAAPYLMFIPADFENDKPTGEPEILLDGWGLQDTHEVLNNLRWGLRWMALWSTWGFYPFQGGQTRYTGRGSNQSECSRLAVSSNKTRI
ncbi:hypothetical protein NYZ99_05435 [Maribacter litopenaei]|uniref:DUF7133 domain-containing protein n=1 Tax=Maribacter litopenaei TaxID=2976127 RepID=A0ABY5Y9V5_9FLAO|nr:hypothetical protein [Maribacter litopenaei]UWX55840.1 hypothetical protein NYZ99_05435 [Maribacter litopenaei]